MWMFDTDEPAAHVLRYGPTPEMRLSAYHQSYPQLIGHAHFHLNGLQPDSYCFLQAKSRDASGNQSETPVLLYKTNALPMEQP